MLTLFIPFIIVGIIISLTHWDEDYTFIFIAKIISISSNSKIGLIFIFGGICLALAYFVAGYVTWVRYAMFSLLKTEDCSIKCSIISMSVSLLFIGLYFVVCIGIYSSTILMLIENLDGISSGEKLFIVFIVTVFLISTTLFIIACGVCWKHGIDLVAYCKRR